MIKALVIGNSHAAGIFTAWKEISEKHSDLAMVFCVCTNGFKNHQGLKALKIENGCISNFQYASDNIDSINLSEFDVFVIYGALQPPQSFLVDLNTNFKSQHFSQAVVRDALNDRFLSSKCFYILRSLRPLTDKKIFVVSEPNTKDGRLLDAQSYRLALDNIKREIAVFDAYYIEQPPETLTNNYRSMVETFKVSDIGHMTLDASKICLLNLINKIKK